MTDTEKIIKGIEICSDDKPSCKGCPYYEIKSPMCLHTLHKEATDLIRRQQAEIEKLKETKCGHWIPQYVSSRGLTDKFACSVCNMISYTSHKYLNCPYKYCEECGAKMEMFGNPEQVKGEENG